MADGRSSARVRESWPARLISGVGAQAEDRPLAGGGAAVEKGIEASWHRGTKGIERRAVSENPEPVGGSAEVKAAKHGGSG